MARYATSIESQTAQTSGVNAGTTVNGYVGYWGGSATAGYRLRRVTLGLRTTTTAAITSQQIQVGIYRQTVAPAGTGLAAAVLGQPLETHTLQTDPTTGMIVTTAGTIGTTGPTIGAVPLKRLSFNSQNTVDFPFEFMEELVCPIGTANGLAFVILANALPALSVLTVDCEIEV
jgi:hypothetical protein